MDKTIDMYDVVDHILSLDREEEADVGVGRYRIWRGSKRIYIISYDPKRNIDASEEFPLTEEGQGEAVTRFVQLTKLED